MSRERDIRLDIQDRLDATGQFSAIYLPGKSSPQGTIAEDLYAVQIDPLRTDIAQGYDAALEGGDVYTMRTALRILCREPDPIVRDEKADQLLNIVRNALNGQSLGEHTFPQKTRVTNWVWQDVVTPERVILATLLCDYLEDGWDSADVAE